MKVMFAGTWIVNWLNFFFCFWFTESYVLTQGTNWTVIIIDWIMICFRVLISIRFEFISILLIKKWRNSFFFLSTWKFKIKMHGWLDLVRSKNLGKEKKFPNDDFKRILRIEKIFRITWKPFKMPIWND